MQVNLGKDPFARPPVDDGRECTVPAMSNNSCWSAEEHKVFLQQLEEHGRGEWKAIARSKAKARIRYPALTLTLITRIRYPATHALHTHALNVRLCLYLW